LDKKFKIIFWRKIKFTMEKSAPEISEKYSREISEKSVPEISEKNFCFFDFLTHRKIF